MTAIPRKSSHGKQRNKSRKYDTLMYELGRVTTEPSGRSRASTIPAVLRRDVAVVPRLASRRARASSSCRDLNCSAGISIRDTKKNASDEQPPHSLSVSCRLRRLWRMASPVVAIIAQDSRRFAPAERAKRRGASRRFLPPWSSRRFSRLMRWRGNGEGSSFPSLFFPFPFFLSFLPLLAFWPQLKYHRMDPGRVGVC